MSQFCPKAIGRFIKAKCYRQPLWHFSWFSSKLSLLCCCTIHADAICNYSDESYLKDLHFFPPKHFFFSPRYFFLSMCHPVFMRKFLWLCFVIVLEYQQAILHLVHLPHWKCKVKLIVLQCGIQKFGIICVIIIRYQSNFKYYVSMLFQT